MWNVLRSKRRLRAFVRKVLDEDMGREGIGIVRAELSSLADRYEKLERLLSDHPQFEAGDNREAELRSPAVSVIMPTWNRARIIDAAIGSVQAQSFKDWELLVIDDGSGDDTADVMANYAADSRIRYVRLSHAGQCVARNHGHSIAKGALIAYLDSDNLWYPDFLLVAVNLFTHRPQLDCAYGALVSDCHHPRILFEPFDRERLLTGNFIDTSAFIHRAELIARYGGFDQSASPLEDWDLVLRYTIDKPAYPLPVLAVRYREMDAIRVSDTQDKAKPTQTVQQKWATARASSVESDERQVRKQRL